jgi:hypothetical protein
MFKWIDKPKVKKKRKYYNSTISDELNLLSVGEFGDYKYRTELTARLLVDAVSRESGKEFTVEYRSGDVYRICRIK